MRVRGRDPIVAGVVAAVCLLLWQRLWGGSETLYLWDAGTYFYPMKDFLGRTVRAGEWPWWNPWIRNGLPFFANPQVGLFYPLTVPFYLLPTAAALNATVILHTVLAATGFFAWLRGAGRSPAAAALGALAIVWGGYALSMTVYLNNLQALAWIGWTWWAWERWQTHRTWRWLACTSSGFALQFLAGEPQVAVVTAAVALLLAWTREPAPGGARGRWAAPVLALAAAAAVAMLATAAQLAPTIELFGESQRRLGLSTGESLGWSLAPAHLHNLVVPRYFESPEGLFDLRRIPGLEQPWVFTSYLGVVVVALGVAGIRPTARSLLWLGLAAAGVFLALGAHNPVVVALADAVPPLRAFRFPEKMLLLPAIAVPALAAAGFDRLREDRGARRRALAAAALLALGGATAWGVVPVVGGIGDATALGFRHVGLFSLLAAAVLASATRVSRPVLAGSLLLLALADLALVNLQVAPVAPATIYAERPAVLEGLPGDSLATHVRIRTSPLGEPRGIVFTMAGIASATHQYYQLQSMSGNLAMTHQVLAEDGAEPFPPRTDDARDAILRELPLEHQVRYLRLQSVAWLIERPLDADGLRLDARIDALGLFRYRVLDPLPRAYLVDRVEIEPDSIAILNRLLSGGEDPRRIAFVSTGPELRGDRGASPGIVRWTAGSNHSVRLEVDTRSRSLLVLTDTWYPGWSVTVNGSSAPLERVNWHFRGVRLEPGRHRVRFDYRPRGLAAGAVVSVIGLAVLVGAVIAGGRRGA